MTKLTKPRLAPGDAADRNDEVADVVAEVADIATEEEGVAGTAWIDRRRPKPMA